MSRITKELDGLVLFESYQETLKHNELLTHKKKVRRARCLFDCRIFETFEVTEDVKLGLIEAMKEYTEVQKLACELQFENNLCSRKAYAIVRFKSYTVYNNKAQVLYVLQVPIHIKVRVVDLTQEKQVDKVRYIIRDLEEVDAKQESSIIIIK